VIHHILVATDGSENAERAVRFSAQVADRRVQAEVTVVYVHLRAVPPVLPASSALDPARAFQALQPELLVPEGMSAEERAQAQQIVNAAVREIRRLVTSPDVSISGRIVVSERVEEGMLHEARETKADMIVVGTRGLSPLRGAIMGSVSHALIEKAECPVLVVK